MGKVVTGLHELATVCLHKNVLERDVNVSVGEAASLFRSGGDTKRVVLVQPRINGNKWVRRR